MYLCLAIPLSDLHMEKISSKSLEDRYLLSLLVNVATANSFPCDEAKIARLGWY